MDTWISLGGGNRRDLLGKLGAGSMRMGGDVNMRGWLGRSWGRKERE